MGRDAFWSLMGMYDYDNTLFDSMSYPTEWSNNDKDNFKYELLTETAELEVIYNDPNIMKSMIGKWSAHRRPVWDHLIDTTQYEYDPIANWDKRETITETRERTGSHTVSDDITRSTEDDTEITGRTTQTTTGSEDITLTKSSTQTDHDTLDRDTSDTQVNSGTDQTVNKVNGFVNSSTSNMVTHDTSDLTHGHRVTNTGSVDDEINRSHISSGTDTTAESSSSSTTGTQSQNNNRTITDTTNKATEGSTEDSEEFTRTYTGKGNIGTMTSQEMIRQEREIARFDIVEFMINDFKNRFLLQIY